LALALVQEDHGADLARRVAKWLVMFLQRPGGQSQFSEDAPGPPAGGDPLGALLHDITARPAADLSVPAMAGRLSMSPRHFSRVFARQTGVSPGRYVERAGWRRPAPRWRPAMTAWKPSRGGPASERRRQCAARSCENLASRRAPAVPASPAPAPGRAARRTADQSRPARRRPAMDAVFVLYDQMTALDLVGPYEVLAGHPSVTPHFAAVREGPVRCDSGLVLHAGTALRDVTAPDLIVVPGSARWLAVLDDSALGGPRHAGRLRRGRHGGAGGDGRERDDQRRGLSRDRPGPGPRGAAVGERAAMALQLGLEYDPDPPFDCGTPEKAPPAVTAAVRAALTGR
jgi:AraC-like DNA-binding protein